MSNKELKDSVASSVSASEEINAQIERTQKIINGLGRGYLYEETAWDSLHNILIEYFKIPLIMEVVKRMNNASISMDAFGYENSPINTAVIIKITEKLKYEAIEEIEETMSNFPKFFLDHADKKLYGVMACVDASDEIKNVLRKKGIYLAVMNDDVFELHEPDNFTPTDYSQKS